ncbi:MAG: SurA N-terminal domain-containing protein [Proteobacteria bacterium]|nr:SurA N-terminal domain-containing protein [Pseudomonadota bacterium]MBU1738633.1 SurA N-terminal domain-containing protein [Pseudomonadota bacterium]
MKFFNDDRTPVMFFALLMILVVPAPSSAELIDRVVAVVNSEVITSTELEKAGEALFRQLRGKTPADQLDKALAEARNKILEDQIDNLLITQEAETQKINVSEAEIDEAVQRVAENNKISVEELHQELARSGVEIRDYRKNIEHNIQRSKLISRQVSSKIVISDKKAKEYYDDVFTSRNTAEGYHILQIGFPWGAEGLSSATREDAKLRAEKIRKLVEEGQDFRELARSFSELPSAEDGGDLGFFKIDEMAAGMRGILQDLEPGKVSPVIELSGAYQFYLILSANQGGTTRYAPFAVFKSEIFNTLYSKEQRSRYENWMKELRERSYIRTLL